MSPQELSATLSAIVAAGTGPLSGGPLAPLEPERPVVPDAPREVSALTVRVDIDDTRPKVWRRLVLRGDLTLDRVHDLLQTAFGWTDSHLHRFWPGPAKRLWRGPYFLTPFDLTEGEEGVVESDVRLDQVLRKDGDRLFYTYDFGDDWTHTIRLESAAPLGDDTVPPAVCTGGRRAGPLEDCGGPPGHNELVSAYQIDPSLRTLEDYLRDWVPDGWEPAEFDAQEVTEQLSLVGLDAEQMLAALSADEATGSGTGTGLATGPVTWPDSLEALRELAPPAVAAQIAQLCVRARSELDVEPTPEDLARIARDYRYVVELAGEDGIPLTAAGWMKPAYVERIYTDLGLHAAWIGKGNREDQTLPVAELRETCQRLGLLRKHKGRLLRTKRAQALTTDEDYLAAIAERLLHDTHPFQRATFGLFALFTAATGRAVGDHAVPIADLLSACGLRTAPTGVDHRHVQHNCHAVWMALESVSGRTFRDRDKPVPGDRRTVLLARAALWPDDLGRS